MEKSITIFTPTFNRGYILNLCHDSLIRQTCKDFVWLVIDDGSTDHTKELVTKWQSEDHGFKIIYHYQNNGGLHTAYNTAYRMVTTELCMCVDSDDFLKDDAVEIIRNLWHERKSERHAGIIALDVFHDGAVIGTQLPVQADIHLLEFYRKGGKGDKKLIYRTDIMQRYPEYPVFEGERYVPIGYKFMLVDQDYKLLILNKPVCVMEYLEDGYTRNRYRRYLNNPKGFAYTKSIELSYEKNIIFILKLCIQYSCFSMLAKKRHFIRNSPRKWMTFCSVPFGAALSRYIKYKGKLNQTCQSAPTNVF